MTPSGTILEENIERKGKGKITKVLQGNLQNCSLFLEVMG